MDNYEKILDYLTLAIQNTRAGSDVDRIEIVDINGIDFARMYFTNGGHKQTCIDGDSGIAMIRDILSINIG